MNKCIIDGKVAVENGKLIIENIPDGTIIGGVHSDGRKVLYEVIHDYDLSDLNDLQNVVIHDIPGYERRWIIFNEDKMTWICWTIPLERHSLKFAESVCMGFMGATYGQTEKDEPWPYWERIDNE